MLLTTECTRERTRRVYRGEQLRALAMPLGGLGTGSIAVCGDGSLRQWQIHNQVNHLACVPHSFFAVWARQSDAGELPVARVLQSSALYDTPGLPAPPTSNDHLVPEVQRRLLARVPGVATIEFTGEYPLAQLDYGDPALPIRVHLRAFNPFIPLDSADSGLPLIVFQFTLTNPGAHLLQAAVVATLQNAVGWDGVVPIVDLYCARYGGNRNTLRRTGDLTAIVMDNPRLEADDPTYGSMLLGTFESQVTYQAAWDDLTHFWRAWESNGRLDNGRAARPSDAGQTWNSALACGAVLNPGESRSFTFIYAWHFPNRTVNFEQGSMMTEADKERVFRIGNYYNRRFANACEVADYFAAHRERLVAETFAAHRVLHETNLPPELTDAFTASLAVLRSPTCFWTEDGRFYGFEGCGGASTPHIPSGIGGSCPLNCTHVWNYEMALARLFPDLERTMRETEWLLQQHPSGYLPHRVLLPLELPRPWERRIGGPAKPALDGLLGAILKTYREYLECGDASWLAEMWGPVERALEYVWRECDPAQRGMITGEQPNTYDVSIYGANTLIGTLYLAALRAGAAMARRLDKVEMASKCGAIFARGRAELEARLWNGEYYVQQVDAAHPEYSWGSGCLSDQLLGQWWANRLNLGALLDPAHIQTALDSIVRRNLRDSFSGHAQKPRAFVTDDDRGLLNCTWREGERPAVPLPYADEVWTGIEYTVAALLLDTGRVELALALVRDVRARYDGRKQNPWNEIECGDHYVRSLAAWSLLEAALGYSYDATDETIRFCPVLPYAVLTAPFFTCTGWGTFTRRKTEGAQEITFTLAYGALRLKTIELCADTTITNVRIESNGQPMTAQVTPSDRTLAVTFQRGVVLAAGETLFLELD